MELTFPNGKIKFYSIHNDPETKDTSWKGPTYVHAFGRRGPSEIRFVRKSAIPKKYFDAYYEDDFCPVESY